MSSKHPMNKNKPRLGRGLSSLIPNDEPVMREISTRSPMTESPAPNPTSVNHPSDIPISRIVPNPYQPRTEFSEKSILELAESIRSTGLIQPIIVRQVNDQFQLVAGERRLRAAKRAGLTHIPVIVRDVDAVTQAQMALIENIQREDLNPIDRANGYRTLIEQLGLTQAELAGRLGEDRSSIANYLRLLDLAEPIRVMVRDGRLSVGHAKLIAGLPDILDQERLANLVLLQGLSVRNLERTIKTGIKPPAPPSPTTPMPHIQDLEKQIARQIGLRVQVRPAARKGRGRMIVHYATLDQFDELLNRLGVKVDPQV
jgi:ParB family transcriptional regulator, chromosome partitioning protein